jgi:hypothetical protein
MSLLVLSIWLAVESNYWINGKSLEPGRSLSSSRRQKGMAISLGVLAGLSFGLSISTRYATALILVPILLYLVIFYAIRAWPSLRRRDVKAAIRSSLRMWPLLVVFAIGLLCVLVPLTAYNTEYFGGPFLSGYDGTTLQQFSQLGNTTVRDTSTEWISSSTDSLSTVFSNFVTILPVLIARMPFLVLLPIGVWIIRRAYPLVALLITWVAINFYTYLSISWVSMYASMPAQILYEPRYFIPAIPALALLAGVAIARISRSAAQWSVGRKRANRGDRQPFAVTLALLLTVALVLCSLVPAMAFFSAPGQAGGNGPPQGQPDGPGGLPNGGRQTGDGPPPGSEGVVGNASGSLSTLSLSNIFS